MSRAEPHQDRGLCHRCRWSYAKSITAALQCDNIHAMRNHYRVPRVMICQQFEREPGADDYE